MKRLIVLFAVAAFLAAVCRSTGSRRPTIDQLRTAADELRVLGDRRHTGSIDDATYEAGKRAILERLPPY